MTATHDCGRSIASIVREIDELRTGHTKLQARGDRYRQARDAEREKAGRVQGVLDEYLDPDDVDIECREDVWRFIRDLRSALEGGA